MDNEASLLFHPIREPTPWFLTTPPHPVKGTLYRGRLIDELDAFALKHLVTLIVAPSGYGKTVLTSEWVNTRAGATAWLTLTRHDEGDEDLVLSGILNALLQLEHLGVTAMTHAAPASGMSTRTLIGHIADVVNTMSEDPVLVIDDAHHAGPMFASNIIGVLGALTAGRLRFVVCGQPELSSWFSAQIAAQEARVIGPSELAFTREEIILSRIEDATTPSAGASDISPEGGHSLEEATEVSRLLEATGGWPIAVQLHRLAADLPPSSGGPDQLLSDYVVANVLARLSPELAEFILATSVCTRLTPSLAQALSGVEDAEALLAECLSKGLFLSWYSDVDGSTVYRWHDEFSARCRDILARTNNSRYAELDVTAARYLAPAFPSEAVLHAIRAGSPHLAIQIIKDSWIRFIIEYGAASLNSYCLRLQEHFSESPEMYLIRASCLSLLGDDVGARVATAQALAHSSETTSFHVTHAFALLFLSDTEQVLASAVETAKRFLEEGAVAAGMHSYCLFLLGWTNLRLRRDPAHATSLLEAALDEAQVKNLPVLAQRARANLLFALAFSGQFTQARTVMAADHPALETAEDWYYYDGGIEPFAYGFIDYWQGNIGVAQQSLGALVTQGGHGSSYAALAAVFLAFCAALEGRPAQIQAAHQGLSMLSKEANQGVPWPVYYAIAKAELYAASGDFPRVLNIMPVIRNQQHIPVVRVMAAELLRRAGQRGEAVRMLGTLSRADRTTCYVAASAHVVAALISHEQGDTVRAHCHLESALDTASPEGVVRPFMSTDERLRTLLIQHAAAGTAHEQFVAARISAYNLRTSGNVPVGGMLSAREREVYGLLCTTMTATEISKALFVSVNTVRTHQQSIYRKLGVTTRREAVRLLL